MLVVSLGVFATLLIVNCLQGCVSLKKGIFIFQGQISSKGFRVAVSWDER